MIQFFPLTRRNTIDELFTANDIFLLEMQEYIVEKLLTAAQEKEKKKRWIFASESRKKKSERRTTPASLVWGARENPSKKEKIHQASESDSFPVMPSHAEERLDVEWRGSIVAVDEEW